jgi:predicted RNA binding protein with dsRBD fold (UPF0201 family)
VVLVRVRAPVRPTEDEARVRQAIANLFPQARIQLTAGGFVAETDSLHAMRQRIFELRIIDTVRGQILHGLAADGASSGFRLSKQAALAMQISFPPTPHALGDLEVTLEAESGDGRTTEQWAWWLCPETKDGEIVGLIEP